MSSIAFPLIYEIGEHRRCRMARSGGRLVIGGGIECQIRLEWNGVRDVEASLEILGESRVRLTIPGEKNIEAEFPLNISIGERELAFFRPVDMHGWSAPAAGTEEGREITISCGGKAPLRRRLQASSPLLIGSDESCGAIVPGEECPSVAVAAWWRGGNHVLLQILDNSAPVEWENRADAFEGEVELPLVLSIAGKIVSAKSTPNAQTKLLPVEQEQPSRLYLGEQEAKRGKKSFWLIAAGVGALVMILTASAIHFLMSERNGVASSIGTSVVATSTNPGGTQGLTTFAKAETSKAPATVAVLEFENSSKKEDMEALRKGLRDMMMTDLSQVSAIKMVERGRLQELLQEMKLAEGQFIDPATAAKLGKGLAASAVLTGSYLALGETIRIDTRLVKVETGEVMMAEQVSGSQSDFFTLQKVLAEKMVERLEVKTTTQEQLALRRPQTVNFEAFSSYSRGVLALEKGDKSKAKEELSYALQKDSSFKLASNALEEVEKEAKKNLAFLDMQIEQSTKTAQERFDSQFAKYRVLADASPHVNTEQIAAHVIVAAHYGLRGQREEERKHLLSYARKLSEAFRDKKSTNIYEEVRGVLLREMSLMSQIVRSNRRDFKLLSGTGVAGADKKLQETSFSLLPLRDDLVGRKISPAWGQFFHLIDTADKYGKQNQIKMKETLAKFLSIDDYLEFPHCWAMEVLQSDLSSIEDSSGIEISGFYRKAWETDSSGLDVGARFNLEAFTILAEIIQLYSKEALDKYTIWRRYWNRAATIARVAVSQAGDTSKSTSDLVVSVLRHVAANADNLEMQKNANEALVKFTQKQKR